MIILASSLKGVRVGEIKKEKRPEDMPLSKIFGYVFLPAIIAAIIGWIVPTLIFGSTIMGSKSNDAFIFACLPIIAFYVSLYIKATGTDKRAIGALLFIFGISIIFWTIYNQNSTGLTLWAQVHTDRTVSPTAKKIAGSLGFLQTVSDTPRLVDKVDEHFVDIKDQALVAAPYDDNNVKLVDGNIVNKKTRIVQVMGPDPYFNNVPKSDWPPGGSEELANTELFQSINPLFIIILTPLLVMLFSYLRKRNKEPSTAS